METNIFIKTLGFILNKWKLKQSKEQNKCRTNLTFLPKLNTNLFLDLLVDFINKRNTK